MKRKALFVLLILLLPSLIYVFFAISKANFRKLPYHGPHKVRDTLINGTLQKDTVFYTIPQFYTSFDKQSPAVQWLSDSIYIALFVDEWNDESLEQLKGLAEYAVRKKEDLEYMNFIFFTVSDSTQHNLSWLGDSLKLDKGASATMAFSKGKYDTLKTYYFVPVDGHEFRHTKLAVLIDSKGRIRGYYDTGTITGMRTLKEDFQHLRLRDELTEHRENFKIEQGQK